MDLAQLRETCSKYAKPAGFKPSYGTAGFRAEASLLHSTVFRCASCYLLIDVYDVSDGSIDAIVQLLSAVLFAYHGP